MTTEHHEQLLDTALGALATSQDWRAVLDELPAPIYATDAEGAVTYWNHGCIALAGRVPELGRDRWCVTWKLYTTSGEFLPHEECPMAVAIKERKVVRDQIAIAERPDGSRVAFQAYPTPLFDDDGALSGAVNMLVDVTVEQAGVLHNQAERCRRLADATFDRTTSKVLGDMAEGFDRIAGDLSNSRE